MIEAYVHEAERYAHRQAVLDADMESMRLRGQRNAIALIAGMLAILVALGRIG